MDLITAKELVARLDYPVMLVDSAGQILAGSPVVGELLPEADVALEGLDLRHIIEPSPEDPIRWLTASGTLRMVWIKGPPNEAGQPYMVKATPVGREDTAPVGPDDLWLVSFHPSDSIDRQRVERKLLLGISSVPIPEMMAEEEELVSAEHGGSAVAMEMLGQVSRHLGAAGAVLFRIDGYQSMAVIGQTGFDGRALEALLNFTGSPGAPLRIYESLVGLSAVKGQNHTFSTDELGDAALSGVAQCLPGRCVELWVDGIGGFGATVTLFSQGPDRETRQFATDAALRLGRHLESANFSRNMYEAYVELQQTQEQMIQSSKMAAIGELATGMAHELRQPVTVINNFFSSIFDHLEQGRVDKVRAKLPEYRERFDRNIQRLTGIIDHLRDFGRQDAIRFSKVELKPFLDDIFHTFLAALLEKQMIRLHWEVPEGLPAVEMDAPRIEQVILNLISNARDALAEREDPTISVNAVREGEWLRLTVRDNGPGIPDEFLGKVLDPFFTTKPVGKGTGIGLSISHGIVQGHNGSIEIGNHPGGGACLELILPFSQPRPKGQTGGNGGTGVEAARTT